MADLGINVIFEGRNLVRILEGLGVTVGISALSVVLSLILGVFVGLGMRSRWRALRWLMQLYLEFVRIMPQIVLLFVAYFGLTRVAGINLDGITASVLVFTLWGGAEMGDLVRGALIAIPRHQYESAYALGLTPRQTMRRVILPQTLRRLAPPAVNLITRMIKTTSLVVLHRRRRSPQSRTADHRRQPLQLPDRLAVDLRLIFALLLPHLLAHLAPLTPHGENMAELTSDPQLRLVDLDKTYPRRTPRPARRLPRRRRR